MVRREREHNCASEGTTGQSSMISNRPIRSPCRSLMVRLRSLRRPAQKNLVFCSENIAKDLSSKKLTFAFDRDDADENALDSTVTMPPAFEVATDVEDFVRGEALPIEVTGSSSSLRWEVEGDCIWGTSGTLSGDKIPADAFDSPKSDEEDNCEVLVTFTRTATGDLDPNFGKGGEIQAIQERKFTVFALAPGAGVSPDDSTSESSSSSSGDAGTSEPDVTHDAAAPSSGDAGVVDAASSDDVTDGGATDGGADSATTTSAPPVDAGGDAADAG